MFTRKSAFLTFFILVTQKKLYKVLEEYDLLSLFQKGKISLSCDGALYTMFNSDPIIKLVINRCFLHGGSLFIQSFFEHGLKNIEFADQRNSMSEIFKQFKSFIQSANIAKKRDGHPFCLPNYNEFIKLNKIPTQSEKYQVANLMFSKWSSFSEPGFHGQKSKRTVAKKFNFFVRETLIYRNTKMNGCQAGMNIHSYIRYRQHDFVLFSIQ